MTRHELAALACKIIAIYIFFKAFLYVGQLIYVIVSIIAGRDMKVVDFIPAVILVLLGLLFWNSANWLASKMVSSDPSPVGFTSIGMDGLLTIAFAVFGAYAIVNGLSVVASQVILLGYQDERFYAMRWETTVTALVWLAVGLWLMFGSKGLAKFVLKMRGQEEEVK